MFSLFKKSTTTNNEDKQHRTNMINNHKKILVRNGKLPIDNILTTERYHPKTTRLSQLAQNNLSEAIEILKNVDSTALTQLLACKQEINKLHDSILATLKSGGKIFISGCGAAGRAGSAIVKQVGDAFPQSIILPKIISILSGGDGSILRAAENFEDNSNFGIRQLVDAGWDNNDLFIGLSASGSAAFIHAQLEYVAKQGTRFPYFIYCNSHDEVAKTFNHSPLFANQNVNKRIHFVSTHVGPMALTGSTRMQAATAQILSVAVPLLDAIACLENKNNPQNTGWELCLNTIQQQLRQTNFQKLIPFIEKEAIIYSESQRIYYHVTPNIALNVLVDTTERSPTFNLEYPENEDDPEKGEQAALCRVIIDNTYSAKNAWCKMLGRDLNPLDWKDVPHTQLNRILGYDLSEKLIKNRKNYLPNIHHHHFYITFKNDLLHLTLSNINSDLQFNELNKLPIHFKKLAQQILIKLMLNIHSTLVMGRLGLYYGNLMVYVRPSNLKLISRGARLAYELIEQNYHYHAIIPAFLVLLTHHKEYQACFMAVIMDTFYQKMMELVSGKSVVLATERAVSDSLERISYRHFFTEVFQKSNSLANSVNRQNAESRENQMVLKKIYHSY